MATHLRKMVSQTKNESIALAVLPPGWFEAIHRPLKAVEASQFRQVEQPSDERSLERHREIVVARHEAVMRLVAMEQAKNRAKGGER